MSNPFGKKPSEMMAPPMAGWIHVAQVDLTVNYHEQSFTLPPNTLGPVMKQHVIKLNKAGPDLPQVLRYLADKLEAEFASLSAQVSDGAVEH